MTGIFLHGLESSGQGYKGRYFQKHFPAMLTPDFRGDLNVRLAQLSSLVQGLDELILVGSSFGGLMAALFAIQNPQRVSRLILLAPALNYCNFSTVPSHAITTPTVIHMGRRDDVTPPGEVHPIAQRIFADLDFRLNDDDHLLSTSFEHMDWSFLAPCR